MRDIGTDVRGLFSDIDSVYGGFCPEVGQDSMRLLAAKNGNLGLYIVRNGNLSLDSGAQTINLDLNTRLKTIIGNNSPVIIDSKKNVHFNMGGEIFGDLGRWKTIPLAKFNDLLGGVERNCVQDYFFLCDSMEGDLYIKINYGSDAYYVSYNIRSAACSVLTDTGLIQYLDKIEKMESGAASFNIKLDFSDAWDMTMRLDEGRVQINSDFCRDFIVPENSWKNYILGFVGFAASTDSVKVESLTKVLGLTAWQVEQIVSGAQTGWVDLDFSEEITAKISNAGGVAKIFVTDRYQFDCGDSYIILNDGSLLSAGYRNVVGDDTGSGWKLNIEGTQIHSDRSLTVADVKEAKIISPALYGTCAYYIIAGQCFNRGKEWVTQGYNHIEGARPVPVIKPYNGDGWMCVSTGRSFDISGQSQVGAVATGVDNLAPVMASAVVSNVPAVSSVGGAPIADDVTALQATANRL